MRARRARAVRLHPRPRPHQLHPSGDEYGGVADWSKLPELEVCREKIYRQLSHYILNVYKYPYKAGEERSLALLTQKKYVRNLIWDAYFKYKDGAYKDFFECLSESGRSWLKSMEAEIEREVTAAAMLAGTKVVSSAVALHLKQIASVIAAYSLHASHSRSSSVGDIKKKTVRSTCARAYACRKAHALLTPQSALSLPTRSHAGPLDEQGSRWALR